MKILTPFIATNLIPTAIPTMPFGNLCLYLNLSAFLPISFPATLSHILTTILAGILIFAPVAGLRPVRELGFVGENFSMPGSGKDPILVVLMMAS